LPFAPYALGKRTRTFIGLAPGAGKPMGNVSLISQLVSRYEGSIDVAKIRHSDW
jgi:hypothetical protein